MMNKVEKLSCNGPPTTTNKLVYNEMLQIVIYTPRVSPNTWHSFTSCPKGEPCAWVVRKNGGPAFGRRVSPVEKATESKVLYWLSWSHHERFMVATMTWLTVTEYVCRNHFPTLIHFMTYRLCCNKSNTMGATIVARITYPFGAPEFTSGF